MLDASGTQCCSPAGSKTTKPTSLSKLIDDALLVAKEVVWAVDQPGGGAALLLALLRERDQKVLYASLDSAWIGLATPTGESPKPMPAMLALSPTGPE
jgi:hypothetical protein